METKKQDVAYSCISLNVICFEPLTAWLVRTSVVCVCVCVSWGTWEAPLLHPRSLAQTRNLGSCGPRQGKPWVISPWWLPFTVASSAAWGSSPARSRTLLHSGKAQVALVALTGTHCSPRTAPP